VRLATAALLVARLESWVDGGGDLFIADVAAAIAVRA